MINLSVQKSILHKPELVKLQDEVLVSDLIHEYLEGLESHAFVIVNGNVLSQEEYGNSVVEDGDYVNLSLRPEAAAGAWLINNWLLATTLAMSAYAGYQAYNMDVPETGEGQNEKLARIQGLRNTPRKYEPVPILLGKHRVTPDWAAQPYVETVGNTQYYNMLLSGGYAPQKLEDFRIGDTPIDQYEDVQVWYSGEYGGSEVESDIVTRYSSSYGTALSQKWPHDVSQESVAVELEIAEDPFTPPGYITRTTGIATDEIKIDLSFPTGLIKISDNEEAKELRTRRHLETLITEQTSGDQYYIANVKEFDGTSSTRYGAYTGDVYKDTSTGTYYWVDYGYNNDGRVKDADGNGYRRPRGTEIAGLTTGQSGSFRVVEIPSADIQFYDRRSRTVGVSKAWSDALDTFYGVMWTITDKTKADFFESIKFNPGVEDQFDVSIRDGIGIYSSGNNEYIDNYVGVCRWDFLTTYRYINNNDFTKLIGADKEPKNIDGTFVNTFRPVTIIVRIKATNQLSGMLDKFNYLGTSAVPSNWSNDWRDWLNQPLGLGEDPATLYRWLLQGPMNANPLPNEKIHLDSLFDWNTFCSDPFNDQEFFFRTSGFLREPSTLLKELNKVAWTGRGEFSFVDGKYGVSVKKEQDIPIQMFTPKNSRNFTSSRQFPEDTDGIKFEFPNENQDYEQDEGIYYNPDKAVADRKGLYSSVELPYVTNPTIATHQARFGYFENRLQREVYSIETDIEGLKATRGDLVLLQNDIIEVGIGNGRVTEAVGTTFYLDETIGLVAGTTYGISVRTVNSVTTGTARYEGDQEWTVLTGSNPVADDLIVYGDAGIETIPCVVKETDYGNDFSVKLTLANYSSFLYQRDQEAVPAYNTNISTPRISYKRPAAPTIITPSNPADLANGTARVRFKASPREDSPVRMFSLEARSAITPESNPEDVTEIPSNWETVGVVEASEGYIDLELGLDNYWELRGRALSENGLYSPYSDTEILIVPTGPAQDVTSITLQELVNTPKTPDANLSTIAVFAGIPSDGNFAYAEIQYRRVGQFTYVNAGRIGSLYDDRVDIVVPSDGSEYEIVATSVSITGVRSESDVRSTITVYDIQNDETKPEITIPNVRGLEIFDQGNSTEFVGRDVEFNWRDTSVNEWTPIGSEQKQGVDYGGLDLYFKDYEIKIFDTSNNLLSTYYREDSSFVYSYELNRQDYKRVNGVEGANRQFRIEVRIRGRNNQFSEKPARLTVENPEPQLPAMIVSAGFTHLSLRYETPEDRDFVGVKVWLSDTSGFTPSEANLAHPLGADTSISIDGLISDTTYYIVYQSFDAFGAGPVSDEFSFNTQAVTGANVDTTPPSIPGNLTLTSGVEESSLTTKSWVKLDWDASTDDGIISGYFVSYRTNVNSDPVEIFTGSTEYRITDAVPGRTYFVKVKAQDWAGNTSDYSTEISISASGDTGAPAVPTSISATGGLDKVIVKWTNPSDDDFLATRLHRGTTSGFTPSGSNLITTQPGRKGEVVEAVDAEVTNGTEYFYKLVAVDVTGNTSSATASVNATPNKLTDLNIANYFEEAAIGNAYIDNLDATKITAGDIATDRMSSNWLSAGQASITQLSAITADFGEMTSGTVTGATIRTAATGARVELNSTDGVIGRNSSSDITFKLDTDGSGYLGITNAISWDINGAVTVPGTLISGEIVGNTIKTGTSGWRLEMSSAYPMKYTDGTSVLFSLDSSGNAQYGGSITVGQITDAGALASKNSVDWSSEVDGSGKPEDGADVTSKHSNSIDNPSFEAGNTGWGANDATIVSDATNSRSGNYCGRFQPADGYGSLVNEKEITISEGDRVIAQGYGKVTSGPGSLDMAINWLDGSRANVGTSYSATGAATTSAYKQLRVIGDAPANAVYAQFRFYLTGSDATTVAYADDAYMAIVPRNSDIDALGTTNGPAAAGADVTKTKIDEGMITTGGLELGGSNAFLRTTDKDSYTDNTAGIWIGKDGGTAKAYIGNSTNHVKWTGSSLEVAGKITIASNSSGYSSLSDKPTSLSDVNSTEGSKLGSVESGADVTSNNPQGLKWVSELSDVTYADKIFIRGSGNNNPASANLSISGTNVFTTGGRGLSLAVVRRSDHSVVNIRRNGSSGTALSSWHKYDIYADENERARMRDALTEIRTNANATLSAGSWGGDVLVFIASYDAWRLDTAAGASLFDEMVRHGASKAIENMGASGNHRSPYTLIGSPGIGESAGIEVLSGIGANDPRATFSGLMLDGDIAGFLKRGDITGENTANDTNNVAGQSGTSIKNNANAGATFTSSDAGAMAYLDNADWGSTLANIPARITNSATTGLNLTDTYMGYYNAGWKTYIQNNGNFHFGGTGNNYIDWNGSTLVLALDTLGAGASNPGTDSVALGSNASAGGNNSIAAGVSASSAAADSIAMGRGTGIPSTALRAIAIGKGASVADIDQISIGTNATASDGQAISVGTNAYTAGVESIAFGYDSEANGDSSLMFGTYGTVTGIGSTYVGVGGTVTGPNITAVGRDVNVTEGYSVAIGEGTSIQSTYAIALGRQASVSTTAYRGVAIGYNVAVNAGHSSSVALGYGASTTASSQIMLGSSFREVNIPGDLVLNDGEPNTIGQVALCTNVGRTDFLTPGETVSGSDLEYSNANGSYTSSYTLSGTWRCLGYAYSNSNSVSQRTTVFVRIS